MDKLEFVIRHTPDTDRFHLDYSGLSSLDPLMPGLASLRNLKELYLHDNSLSALPNNFSILSNLEKLDISKNPLTDLTSTVSILSRCSRLSNLSVSCSANDEVMIARALPALSTLNGAVCKRNKSASASGTTTGKSPMKSTNKNTHPPTSPSTDSSVEGIHMTAHDVENVAELFDLCTNLRVHKTNDLQKTLDDNFDRYCGSVMQGLAESLEAVNSRVGDDDVTSVYLRNAIVLHKKYDLYNVCYDELIQQHIDNNQSETAMILSRLQEMNMSIVKQLTHTVESLYVAQSKDVTRLNAMVATSERETADLLDAAELLEKEISNHQNEKAALEEEFDTERQALLREIDVLRSSSSATPLSQGNSQSNSGGAPSGRESQSVVAPSSASKRAPSSSTVRILSLRQLKETIHDIYQSKTKYDDKCQSNNLPRETMEQHVYTYLNQKYGLKNLIIDWASAIIHGIKTYSELDNDVAVFGKILRNEIDEEFRFLQKQLKDTVQELLRVYLRGKFPLKSEEDINNYLYNRLKSFIYDDEMTDIVSYMYNKEDAGAILNKINDLMKKQSQVSAGQQAAGQKRGPRTLRSEPPKHQQLAYIDFIKVLLDFQLKGHEKFLLKFTKLFRQFDSDKNGILNEDEFKNLIISIDSNKSDESILALLAVIDPGNHQCITFSECVTVLSSELVHVVGAERE